MASFYTKEEKSKKRKYNFKLSDADQYVMDDAMSDFDNGIIRLEDSISDLQDCVNMLDKINDNTVDTNIGMIEDCITDLNSIYQKLENISNKLSKI